MCLLLKYLYRKEIDSQFMKDQGAGRGWGEEKSGEILNEWAWRGESGGGHLASETGPWRQTIVQANGDGILTALHQFNYIAISGQNGHRLPAAAGSWRCPHPQFQLARTAITEIPLLSRRQLLDSRLSLCSEILAQCFLFPSSCYFFVFVF